MTAKFLFLCCVLIVISPLHCYDSYEKYFREFASNFNKSYITDKGLYVHRLNYFTENLEIQEELNRLSRFYNDSAVYGINKFSDLSNKEFEELYLSNLTGANVLNMPSLLLSRNSNLMPALPANIPKRVDWREKKIISGIKNQKSCGGCWAFSTVEAVEAMHALKTGQLEDLSAQEVLDCSYSFESRLYGCKGGDTCTALGWMNKTKTPIVKTAEYPVVDKPEFCKMTKSKGVVVTNYTCNNYIHKENDLLRVLAEVGPVAVAVDATTWQSYLGGIIRFHCGQRPNNHAVLIVGYDTTGEVPFYIVKNSWGADFGDHGYLYVAIGNNVCGIVQEVSTVQV